MAREAAKPVTVVQRRNKAKPTTRRTRPVSRRRLESRLIREEAIRRGARLSWPDGDEDWADWCVRADRASPFAGFDPERNAIHAGLIDAIAQWRQEAPNEAADLETVLPHILLPPPVEQSFLLPQQLADPACPTRPTPLQLDPEMLDRIEADTVLAAASLGEIFSPEPSPASSGMVQNASVRFQGSHAARADGLDRPHEGVLTGLAGRRSWTKAQVEELCAQHGLRLAGAWDVLNETAYSRCGEPLLGPIDSDDASQPAAINHDVLQEMLQ